MCTGEVGVGGGSVGYEPVGLVIGEYGPHVLDGKEGCNKFCIGIEFQGNTLEKPLTEDQIKSAIEYLLPLIKKYKIPVSHIVSHKFVRDAYKKKYPNKRCSGKVDITDTEYKKFMKRLKAKL